MLLSQSSSPLTALGCPLRLFPSAAAGPEPVSESPVQPRLPPTDRPLLSGDSAPLGGRRASPLGSSALHEVILCSRMCFTHAGVWCGFSSGATVSCRKLVALFLVPRPPTRAFEHLISCRRGFKGKLISDFRGNHFTIHVYSQIVTLYTNLHRVFCQFCLKAGEEKRKEKCIF